MSGKLSRRVMRSQNPAPFGEKHRYRNAEPHLEDDDCALCRMAREQGLETQTMTLPNGTTMSVTVVPKGWQPPD